MAPIIKTMIPIYGRLVLAGIYTVDPSDTTKKQVPEQYIELVCEWCVNYTATHGNS